MNLGDLLPLVGNLVGGTSTEILQTALLIYHEIGLVSDLKKTGDTAKLATIHTHLGGRRIALEITALVEG